MARSRHEGIANQSVRTYAAVLIGIAVAVLMVLVNVSPAAAPSSTHAPGTRAAPPRLPSLLPKPPSGVTLANFVDPQFVPLVLSSPGASGYGRFGWSVAASGHFVAVGAPFEEGPYDGSSYAGRVYITNTATGQTSWIQAPDWNYYQDFGYSVALSGGTLVVGAPVSNDDAGAAYVYQDESGNWALIASLTSPNAQIYKYNLSTFDTLQQGGNFGISVGVSGSTVVVGAPYENSTGEAGAGHVYIFNLQTNLVRMISSPAPQLGGTFGQSVAVSGNRVVVGAPYQFGSGAAFLFAASTGDFIRTFSSLYPTYSYDGWDFSPGQFGRSVAINGTLVAVGAPYETAGSIKGGGHAYVFNLLNGSEMALNASRPTTGGLFGFSVAITASTVLVGSLFANVSFQPLQCGAAYLFSAASGAQISSEFVSPESSRDGYDGFAVAETASQFVVGAPDENASGAYYGGHAYIYNQVPLTLASPHALSGGSFGNSVAVNVTVVIGAPDEFADSTDGAGHAYVLASHTGSFLTLTSPAAQLDGAFGYSVGVAGNVVAVGAPQEGNLSAEYIGNAYLFSTSGTLVATLHTPLPQSGSYFGYSIAVAGNLVVVGAPGENLSAGPLEGAAYVFSASTGNLLWTLASPNGQSDGLFGYSVAISGGKIVVGAPGEGGFAGAAYVFSASTGDELFALSDPLAGSNDFGVSVAAGGSTIVVGAPGQDFGANLSAGEAFVFSSSLGSLKADVVTPNPVTGGEFGSSVADNGGTIVVGAEYETAFGVQNAGNIYTVNPSNGAVLDRYNSPDPTAYGEFGVSVAIGPAGVIVAGEPSAGAGTADLFFL